MKTSAALVQRILQVLPQTQCTRCGYPDCAGYAQAIAEGQAGIHQCPPGGQQGVERLAALTQQEARALDPTFGVEGPRSVAFIDEDWCIGCTLCLDACPTDAIVGSNKRMHTVIEAHCTGCELCLPVCPVDCILMENASGQATGWNAWSAQQADNARTRYAMRTERLAHQEEDHAQRMQAKAEAALADWPGHSQHTHPEILAQKRSIIEAALARARAKRPSTD